MKVTYDVCIIGSGAGGGMAAHVLTQAGANVVMLEAGPEWYSTRDSAMLTPNYQSPRRGAATKARPFGEFDGCFGGWEIEGEPYTRAGSDKWDWFRARMLGGRTNHWGRISLRYGPDDFRRKSLDGLGDDWPITYDELAPYYDRVEDLIGVYGSRDGIRNAPDGKFLPAPKPRCWELMLQKHSRAMGIPCVSSRQSILTRSIHGRAACHYCGQCNRGCRTNSNFSSPEVLIKPALGTGKLTLITNAFAIRVDTDSSGKASGVTYIDTARPGVQTQQVAARAVVLAASACESARLLLNSGIANSSGTVGKYLTDSTGLSVTAFIPAMADHVPHNEEGAKAHVYMPWWVDDHKAAKLDFPRGYHIEVGGGMLSPPAYGIMSNVHMYPAGGGFGAQLKADYRRYYGATINLAGRGEMIPNADSYCELDPKVKDKYGVPVLRFHFKWQEHERLQAKHMQETFRSMLRSMGGHILSPERPAAEDHGLAIGGRIIHEAGTVRMGNDPRTSVLNRNCQSHDVKNLFVADAGPFVSNPDKNATWTILALAWRTSAYIASQVKARAL
jgi:choline dehydrogenase-like flavoprotein